MGDIIVGSVGVTVTPDVRKWDKDLRAKLLPQADKLGESVGTRMGNGIRRRLREELKRLPDATIDADTSKAEKKLGLLDNKIRYDTKNRTVNIGIDDGDAKARLALFKATVDRDTLTKTQKIKVDADTSVFDKLRGKLSGGGPSALGLGVGALTALAPAVVGLGATALPVLGGLVASFAAAGAGAGAFAAVAIPAFKNIKANSKALATAQTNVAKAQQKVADATTKAQKKAADKGLVKALDAQSAALKKLSPAERDAVKQYNSFTAAVKKFEKQEEPQAYKVIGGGLKLITDQLPKLRPLIGGASDAFSTLETDADKALNAPFYRNFFKFLQKDAKGSIIDLGRTAGNVFTGIAGLVQGFDPEVVLARRGLVGISQDFANFGKDAAAGKSGPFKQFVDFTHTIAPQAKQDVTDIGKLLGNVLIGLGPSVSPSLKLLDDVAKGLGPVIKPIEKQLPGVIRSVDGMVRKLAPVAGKLSQAFSKGAADEIKSIAGFVGKLADAANRLPAGVLSTVGSVLGAMAVLKFTGVGKLAGYLSAIGSAERGMSKGGIFTSTVGGPTPVGTFGRDAEKAAPKLGKFARGLSTISQFVWPVALGIGIGQMITATKPMQDFQRTFFDWRENLEKLPGPLGTVGGAANNLVNKFDDVVGNVKKIGGKGTSDINKFREAWAYTAKGKAIVLKVTGQENVKQAFADAKRIADGLKPLHTVTLIGKDGATRVIRGVHDQVSNLNKAPGVAHLSAQDKASATIGKVKSGIGSVPKSHSTSIDAKDGVSSVAARTRAAIDAVKGKTVSVGANVFGLGAVGALNGAIGSLHSKSVNINTTYTTKFFGKGKGHATGGYIDGPGTGTSDSIPARLSKGEYVLKAASVKRLGVAFLNRLNGGAGGPSPAGGYARGGKVLTEAQYLAQQRQAANPNVRHTATEWRHIETLRKAAAKKEAAAEQKAERAATVQRANLASAGQSVVSQILGGMTGNSSVSAIQSAAKAVLDKIRGSFKGRKESSLVEFVRRDNAAMGKLATARNKVIGRLQQAQQLATQVTQDTRSYASVTNLQTATAKGISVQLKTKLRNIQRFQSNLKKVSKMGLSPQVIADIVAAGPEEGGALLAQLAHGSKNDIASINRTNKQINKVSAAIGRTAVNATLGGSAARDFVSGLNKQRSKLEHQMDALASRFANTLGRAFGLKKLPGRKKAAGGFISGPGSSTSDSIPAHLSNGEYVVRARAVAKYGRDFFDSINNGQSGGSNYANGGAVNAAPASPTVIVVELDGKVLARAVADQNKRDIRVRVR